MTREELDFIGSMNMCDEISNEAYKKIVCHCEEQEPCEDAVSRQAVIDAIQEHLKNVNSNNEIYAMAHRHIEEVLARLPSVSPARPKGKWEEYLKEGLKYKCSECGSRHDTPWWYCPNCGAEILEIHKTERPKGKWIADEVQLPYRTILNYHCSVCGRKLVGYSTETLNDAPFCHCGADCRGEQDE